MAPTALRADERDDAALAVSAANGDRGAFAAIYDRYADRLHDFCIGMLRDRDAAADCVQDVFVIAATKLTQLREPDRLRSWLYAIARSEALARIRHRRREQPSEELPEMVSTGPELATLAARNELADLINDACGGLSDRDRTVLELAYRQDLSGPELADALGVTNKNANNLVERLRDTIARSLGALLISRQVKADPGRCPELAAMLADWDGAFTVLMRKRIARHIDGCPTCEDERARMVTPAALLGAAPVVIPAPAWLRDATLSRAPLSGSAPTTPGQSWWPPSDFDAVDVAGAAAANTVEEPRTKLRNRGRMGIGAALVLIGIAGGTLLARPSSAFVVPVNDPETSTPQTTLVSTTASTAPPPAVTTSVPVPPPPPAPSTPAFTAPPSTPTTPAQPSPVPRTSTPSTSEEQGPSSFEPSPVNPRPKQPQQQEPEPQQQQPAPEPDEPDGGTSDPPPKKVVPTIEQQPPKNQSPKQSPNECTPQNPCDSGPPVFS